MSVSKAPLLQRITVSIPSPSEDARQGQSAQASSNSPTHGPGARSLAEAPSSNSPTRTLGGWATLWAPPAPPALTPRAAHGSQPAVVHPGTSLAVLRSTSPARLQASPTAVARPVPQRRATAEVRVSGIARPPMATLQKIPAAFGPGESHPHSHFVVHSAGGAALRATPTRVGGSSAKVRWALDETGRPAALHTSRLPLASRAADHRDALERAAYRALGRELAPRAEYLDGKGRRTLVMPLWDTDLFTLLDCLTGDAELRWVGRKLLRDVANDYVRLHARGIAHNDCKPENILVRRSGDMGLTDVDCAFVEDLAAPAAWRFAMLASPSYPAPETSRHGAYGCTRAVDMFRFGLCLLSFYGADDYANFTSEEEPLCTLEACTARAAQNLTLIARLQNERAGRPVQGLNDEHLRRSYGALSWLSADLARIDPEVHAFVLDEMLAFAPHGRPDAPRLLATAQQLLPPGSEGERLARTAVARVCGQLPAIAAQDADLRALAKLAPQPG